VTELRYLSFILLVLMVAACEKKKTSQKTIPIDNTTEIYAPKNDQTPKKAPFPKQKADFSQTTKSANLPTTQITQPANSSSVLVVKDIDDKHYKLIPKDKGLRIDGIRQKDLLITIFSSWCPPCKGQLPYIQDIQNRHVNNLYALGVLVNDDISNKALHHFLKYYGIRFPITRNKQLVQKIIQDLDLPQNHPLPLTILYHNGRYRIHYEGATPPEMIEHDIATPKDD